MKNRWHFLIPALAVLFQPVPIAFMRTVAWMTYKDVPTLPEPWVWGISLAGLAVCGALSMGLGALGTYALLTRTRPIAAVPLVVLCCIPALVAGAVYLRAVFVFLAIV